MSEPATPTLASSSSQQSNLSTNSTSNSLSANSISKAFSNGPSSSSSSSFSSSTHRRTTSNGSNTNTNTNPNPNHNPHAPPLVGMSGGAFDSNGSDDKSALAALLQGMQSLQLEVARLHARMDSVDENRGVSPSRYGGRSPMASPASRPLGLTRSQSSRSQNGGLQSGSSSPELQPVLAPHLALAPSVMAQPGPILATEPSLGLWCVVPAGGAGTRLWPLSREGYPKFLLDLTGAGRSLLQSTWDRLLPLSGSNKLMIVTGQSHVKGVSEQLPELSSLNLLAEPSPKESAAAIGFAAAVLAKRDPEAVLGSFAADHIISGRDAFESAVTEAVAVARTSAASNAEKGQKATDDGYLVTIGIAPSHPSTGFGYIKLGQPLSVPNAPNARRVTEFKEKPDARTASKYLSTGDYRWNGGMFVVKARTLLQLLKKNVPDLWKGLNEIANAWVSAEESLSNPKLSNEERETLMSKRDEVLKSVWPTLPKIAIDHAVAEPAARDGQVAVVPATFGWDDVGDFSSLADLIPADKGNEARVLGDQKLVVTESQAGGLIVPAAGRIVACLGVDDVVIVDTPDALLITTRARSQDVKKIVARCKKSYPALC